MKFRWMAALAAGASLAAGAAVATTLQFTLTDGDTGTLSIWGQSPTPSGEPRGPFEAVGPVANFGENGVADSAMAASAFYDSAVSSRPLDNGATGETDAVRAMGAPVPEPSIWAWMLARFDGLGTALRRIAASA
jgi:hypothetical protein